MAWSAIEHIFLHEGNGPVRLGDRAMLIDTMVQHSDPFLLGILTDDKKACRLAPVVGEESKVQHREHLGIMDLVGVVEEDLDFLALMGTSNLRRSPSLPCRVNLIV